MLDRFQIDIPKDTTLTISITPIDYKVKVSGTDDEELINQIEKLLETGENSKELFLHIMKSLSSDSAQYSLDAYQKYQTAREMYEVTGYHVKDLEVIDGRFVTPDGRDLLDVYKEELEKDPVQRKRSIMHWLTMDHSLASLRKPGMIPFRILFYRLTTAMDL